MKHAISYTRYSSKRQKLGSSQERQVDVARRYCEQEGLVLLEEIVDQGLSAYRGDHVKSGKLGVLLAQVKAGAIPKDTVLVVESIDRLSRETPIDALEIVSQLVKASIAIAVVRDDLGSHVRAEVYTRDRFKKSPWDLHGLISEMQRAHEESEIKARRARNNWKAKVQAIASGETATTRVPGWIEVRDVVRKGTRLISGTRHLHPERAPWVLKMVDWSLGNRTDGDGVVVEEFPRVGLTGIAKRLNKAGVPAFQGVYGGMKSVHGWSDSSVKFTLTHPALYGAFVFNRKVDGETPEPIEDYYPAVISKGRWLLLQQRIRNAPKTGGGRRRRLVPNLFIGLMKCAQCGGAMHIGGNAPEARWHYRYYYCHRRRRAAKACSNGRFWRVADFEEHVLQYIAQDFDPNLLMPQAQPPEEETARISTLQDEIRAAEDEIERARARILTEQNDRRWNLLMDSITNREDQLQAFRDELLVLEQQAAQRKLSPSITDQGRHLKELAAGMRETDEDRARLRAACERLIDRIEVDCDPDHGFASVFFKNGDGHMLPRQPGKFWDAWSGWKEQSQPIMPKQRASKPRPRKPSN
ncbi:MAG: recombinase family protein [Candidatus Sumerlaeia bacterium]|nr:recombinase family protein [Candidatus Sumerlaeia bacterium]